jgi:hypothetical protein
VQLRPGNTPLAVRVAPSPPRHWHGPGVITTLQVVCGIDPGRCCCSVESATSMRVRMPIPVNLAGP